MRPVYLSDIKDLVQYERERPAFQRHVIETRKRRRVALGDRISISFENRDTVLYQIQEMMRAERIVDQDRIQEEIDTYNPLVPGKNELTATLFIEIDDMRMISRELNRLLGIDEHVYLVIGQQPPIRALFEPGQSRADRLSAVQYIRFPLTDSDVQTLITMTQPVRLRITHPNYQAEAVLSDDTRRALADDLQRE